MVPTALENAKGTEKTPRFLARLRQFVVEEVWEMDVSGAPLWRRAAVSFVRLVSVAIRGFVENKCRLRAAALTYATVFSLIPILALGFAMAGAFKGPIKEKIEDLKRYAVRTLAPEDEGVFEEAVTRVNEFVEKFNNLSIGAVGAILLIFSVVSLLTQIESALNETWGIRHKRAFVVRVLMYWGLVTLGTIILAASLSLAARSAEVSIISRTLEIGVVQRLVEFITPYLTTSIFLAFIYKFIPNTPVRLRPAIVGGVVGGVLWEISKNLYVFYVTEMLKGADVYVKVYSGMAAVPLFLLWLYLSWIIFLLGAEIAFAVQNTETYYLERKAKGMSQRYRDILSLRVMLLAARHFLSGRTGPNLERLALETQAPVRILNDITYDLCRAGLLVETADPERRFAPAVPLESFTPHTVLTRLRQIGRTPPPDRDTPDFGVARDIMERSDAANADLFRSSDFATLAKTLPQGASGGETGSNGHFS